MDRFFKSRSQKRKDKQQVADKNSQLRQSGSQRLDQGQQQSDQSRQPYNSSPGDLEGYIGRHPYNADMDPRSRSNEGISQPEGAQDSYSRSNEFEPAAFGTRSRHEYQRPERDEDDDWRSSIRSNSRNSERPNERQRFDDRRSQASNSRDVEPLERQSPRGYRPRHQQGREFERPERESQRSNLNFREHDRLHPQSISNPNFREYERPPPARQSSGDWQPEVSRASETGPEKVNNRQPSPDWNQRNEDGIEQEPSSSRSRESEMLEALLKNWTAEQRQSAKQAEARLLRLLDDTTAILVFGEGQRSKSKWSLGIMDDAFGALGRIIQTRGYPQVTKIKFVYCRLMGLKGFAALARAISMGNMPMLEEISFQSIHTIGDSGFQSLARAFESGGHFSQLTTLRLTDNRMDDKGMMAIAGALGSGNFPNLKLLHLGSMDENFKFEGAKTFARVLKLGHLPQLEDLRFRGCVARDGIEAVVEALGARENKAPLVSLDVRHSPLGIRGMKTLERVFGLPHFRSSLNSLDLSVGAEDLRILFGIFRSRNADNLKRVSISDVCLGERELLDLAALLEARHLPGLLELSADCYENTTASAQALVRAYEENDCLIAELKFDWPSEDLKSSLEVHRQRNIESEDLT